MHFRALKRACIIQNGHNSSLCISNVRQTMILPFLQLLSVIPWRQLIGFLWGGGGHYQGVDFKLSRKGKTIKKEHAFWVKNFWDLPFFMHIFFGPQLQKIAGFDHFLVTHGVEYCVLGQFLRFWDDTGLDFISFHFPPQTIKRWTKRKLLA